MAEHYELGKRFAHLLSHLLKEGKLEANPARVVPNGLADAKYWIDYQEQGKVISLFNLKKRCSLITFPSGPGGENCVSRRWFCMRLLR